MKTAPDSPEFTRFTEALRTVLSVPKTEVMRRMEEERANRPGLKRGPKPKYRASRVPGAASRVPKP